MKLSNFKGITLISLVITIIVMLIIAGVVISNSIGNNSSIEKAQTAKLTEEQRSKKELLEQALIKYNSGNYVGDKDLREFLLEELEIDETVEEEGKIKANIARFTDLDGNTAYVIKNFLEEMAYITEEDGIWSIEAFGKDNLGIVAKLDDNDILISPKSKDELNIESDKDNYAIITADDLEDVSFDIPANTTVSLKLLSNLNITNQGLKRAAINLNEGSVLNLTVEGKVTVNSTFGEDASVSDKQEKTDGGYAGIHVPSSATLNLNGDGVITCYGGSAGKGGSFTGGTHGGGSGGGGAGAGIGGNGGSGGAGKNGISNPGGNGEDCGTVNISGSLTVYAYGGAGGSGGDGFHNNAKNVDGSGGGRRLSWCWNWWRWRRRPEEELVVLELEDILVVLLKV